MDATENSSALKRSLREQFDEARRQTDAIFDLIAPEAFYERPIQERHRVIFYLGHLESFDWNMIARASFGLKPLHREFEQLFSFGIDPVDGKLPQDKPADWPATATVRQYNAQARNAVDDCLSKVDFSKCERPYVENGLIFWTALEHRLMHLETLSYMFHWLPYEMKKGLNRPVSDPDPGQQPKQKKIRVPAGEAKLGINRKESSMFGWDNEYEGHIVHVPEFEIDVYKVTNGAYLEFIEAGGYEESALWSQADWTWITSNDIRHPKFWVKRRDKWEYRAMSGEIPLPESWPVYVSHAEASAFATWKREALPTEAEFHRASLGQEVRGNLGLTGWDPKPVQRNEGATSIFGTVEMVGNGWEWTSTVFSPFPGFERSPFYPGYSADFFDNKHLVVKGASARTALRLTRPSFRNWFQPHYPNIYAGFRCVRH